MVKKRAKAHGTKPIAPQARYDAAGHGRRLRGWVTPTSGPNRAIDGLETIRNRARDAERNEWAATSGTRVWTTNLIGVGIYPRPVTKDAHLKARLIALWNEWTPYADADGVLDFYGMQTLGTRSWISGGELFIRFRSRRPEDGLAVPLQVQLLESDMVPMLDTDSAPGLPRGNRIRSGIELDRIGRRVAFWMYRYHPVDKPIGGINLPDLVRVPADQVRHLYEPLRPGQLRGVSQFAPILTKLRGVMDFDDAVLERQKLANLFTLFITRTAATADPNINPVTGQPISQYSAGGAPLAAMEPGISHELMPGEDVRFSEPPDSGANYADFMRAQHLGVAAGEGTPYELLTGDLKDISDRTLRVIINEFRRHCEQRQWQIIIPMFCQPVRDAWADAAWMVGLLNGAERAEAKRVTWQPQGWAYLHPVQDAQGKRIEVEAGFRSRSSVIAERGEDPDAVDVERAEDEAREDRLGLSDEPEEPGAAVVNRGLTEIRASLDTLRAAGSTHDKAPLEVHAHVHQAPTTVTTGTTEIHNHVPGQPATPIDVHVEAVLPEQSTPSVTVINQVEPTPISVTNDVSPAQVVVMPAPARKTVTEIERDAAGNIVRATQSDQAGVTG